tara:strand:- start:3639 stop:3869 length:231 start_codon:yes stop_codon:yes gene_type:complete
MPIITFDIPATASVFLNTIAQGGFLRINGAACVRASGTGSTIDVVDLTTGIVSPLASATMVEPMTLLSASFAVTPA